MDVLSAAALPVHSPPVRASGTVDEDALAPLELCEYCDDTVVPGRRVLAVIDAHSCAVLSIAMAPTAITRGTSETQLRLRAHLAAQQALTARGFTADALPDIQWLPNTPGQPHTIFQRLLTALRADASPPGIALGSHAWYAALERRLEELQQAWNQTPFLALGCTRQVDAVPSATLMSPVVQAYGSDGRAHGQPSMGSPPMGSPPAGGGAKLDWGHLSKLIRSPYGLGACARVVDAAPGLTSPTGGPLPARNLTHDMDVCMASPAEEAGTSLAASDAGSGVKRRTLADAAAHAATDSEELAPNAWWHAALQPGFSLPTPPLDWTPWATLEHALSARAPGERCSWHGVYLTAASAAAAAAACASSFASTAACNPGGRDSVNVSPGLPLGADSSSWNVVSPSHVPLASSNHGSASHAAAHLFSAPSTTYSTSPFLPSTAVANTPGSGGGGGVTSAAAAFMAAAAARHSAAATPSPSPSSLAAHTLAFPGSASSTPGWPGAPSTATSAASPFGGYAAPQPQHVFPGVGAPHLAASLMPPLPATSAPLSASTAPGMAWMPVAPNPFSAPRAT